MLENYSNDYGYSPLSISLKKQSSNKLASFKTPSKQIILVRSTRSRNTNIMTTVSRSASHILPLKFMSNIAQQRLNNQNPRGRISSSVGKEVIKPYNQGGFYKNSDNIQSWMRSDNNLDVSKRNKKGKLFLKNLKNSNKRTIRKINKDTRVIKRSLISPRSKFSGKTRLPSRSPFKSKQIVTDFSHNSHRSSTSSSSSSARRSHSRSSSSSTLSSSKSASKSPSKAIFKSKSSSQKTSPFKTTKRALKSRSSTKAIAVKASSKILHKTKLPKKSNVLYDIKDTSLAESNHPVEAATKNNILLRKKGVINTIFGKRHKSYKGGRTHRPKSSKTEPKSSIRSGSLHYAGDHQIKSRKAHSSHANLILPDFVNKHSKRSLNKRQTKYNPVKKNTQAHSSIENVNDPQHKKARRINSRRSIKKVHISEKKILDADKIQPYSKKYHFKDRPSHYKSTHGSKFGKILKSKSKKAVKNVGSYIKQRVLKKASPPINNQKELTSFKTLISATPPEIGSYANKGPNKPHVKKLKQKAKPPIINVIRSSRLKSKNSNIHNKIKRVGKSKRALNQSHKKANLKKSRLPNIMSEGRDEQLPNPGTAYKIRRLRHSHQPGRSSKISRLPIKKPPRHLGIRHKNKHLAGSKKLLTTRSKKLKNKKSRLSSPSKLKPVDKQIESFGMVAPIVNYNKKIRKLKNSEKSHRIGEFKHTRKRKANKTLQGTKKRVPEKLSNNDKTKGQNIPPRRKINIENAKKKAQHSTHNFTNISTSKPLKKTKSSKLQKNIKVINTSIKRTTYRSKLLSGKKPEPLIYRSSHKINKNISQLKNHKTDISHNKNYRLSPYKLQDYYGEFHKSPEKSIPIKTKSLGTKKSGIKKIRFENSNNVQSNQKSPRKKKILGSFISPRNKIKNKNPKSSGDIVVHRKPKSAHNKHPYTTHIATKRVVLKEKIVQRKAIINAKRLKKISAHPPVKRVKSHGSHIPTRHVILKSIGQSKATLNVGKLKKLSARRQVKRVKSQSSKPIPSDFAMKRRIGKRQVTPITRKMEILSAHRHGKRLKSQGPEHVPTRQVILKRKIGKRKATPNAGKLKKSSTHLQVKRVKSQNSKHIPSKNVVSKRKIGQRKATPITKKLGILSAHHRQVKRVKSDNYKLTPSKHIALKRNVGQFKATPNTRTAHQQVKRVKSQSSKHIPSKYVTLKRKIGQRKTIPNTRKLGILSAHRQIQKVQSQGKNLNKKFYYNKRIQMKPIARRKGIKKYSGNKGAKDSPFVKNLLKSAIKHAAMESKTATRGRRRHPVNNSKLGRVKDNENNLKPENSSWFHLPWPLSSYSHADHTDSDPSKGQNPDIKMEGDTDVDSNYSSRLWQLLGFPEVRRRKSLKRKADIPSSGNKHVAHDYYSKTRDISSSKRKVKTPEPTTKKSRNVAAPNRALKRSHSFEVSNLNSFKVKAKAKNKLKRVKSMKALNQDESKQENISERKLKRTRSNQSDLDIVDKSSIESKDKEYQQFPSLSWIFHPFSSSITTNTTMTEAKSDSSIRQQDKDSSHSTSNPNLVDNNSYSDYYAQNLDSNNDLDSGIHIGKSNDNSKNTDSGAERNQHLGNDLETLTTTTKTLVTSRLLSHDD
ncbi:unnamed protein product [Gordionus sp. m RMFG-2023]